VWIPPELEPISTSFLEIVERIKEDYRTLEHQFGWEDMEFEQKKSVTSALRRMLPGGIATNIIWTANHRAIRWVIEMRTDPSAEIEIRTVFGRVAEICIKDFPYIYGDFQRRKLPDRTTQYLPTFSKV
jgi:thymidylate synthase (FAD)